MNILELLRPRQWTKNLLLFAPLIFSQHLSDVTSLLHVFVGFISFCFLSSAMYVANDVFDLAADTHHPLKRLRPLPSGRVSIPQAVFLSTLLLTVGFTLGFFLPVLYLLTAFMYVCLVLSYSMWLKKVVLLDLLIVSFGFVLRSIAGALIVAVPFSPWLIVSTMFGAWFLVAGKRRHELLLLKGDAEQHRSSLGEYSEQLLDQLLLMGIIFTLMSYVLYTLSSETVSVYGLQNLVFTIPFFMYGLLRYLFLVYRKDAGGDPTSLLLTDKPLFLSIILWGFSVVAIIYLL